MLKNLAIHRNLEEKKISSSYYQKHVYLFFFFSHRKHTWTKEIIKFQMKIYPQKKTIFVWEKNITNKLSTKGTEI